MKKYNKIEINGMEFLYSICRIKREDIPEGWFKYSVRQADLGGDLATIEPRVLVNHEMDLLSKVELDFGEDGYIEIEDYNFID